MHLLIPSYTFPTDATPTENAVAYVAYIGADVWDFSSGRITVWLYRSYELANLVPSKPRPDAIEVQPGELFAAATDTTPEVRMPTVPEIDAEAHAAAAAHPDLTPMQLLGLIIYTHLLSHPRLAGATLVITP
jgi:hypothetical protein